MLLCIAETTFNVLQITIVGRVSPLWQVIVQQTSHERIAFDFATRKMQNRISLLSIFFN